MADPNHRSYIAPLIKFKSVIKFQINESLVIALMNIERQGKRKRERERERKWR